MSYPEGVRLSLQEINDPSYYDPTAAYGQSKLANILFAQELDSIMKSKNSAVLVNSFSPGLVHTPLAVTSLRGMLKGLPSFLIDFVVYLFETQSWYPNEASLSGLYLSVSSEVADKRIRGIYYHPITEQIEPDPYCKNASMQKQLWTMTEEVLASKGFK